MNKGVKVNQSNEVQQIEKKIDVIAVIRKIFDNWIFWAEIQNVAFDLYIKQCRFKFYRNL